MSFKVVIPARYGSTRLPAKPLLEIGGKPMIQWVVEQACLAQADEVVVATDDARIAAAVKDPRGGQQAMAMMTRADHASGTDRIAEVAQARGWSDATVVVNVQGDEPQMPPALIDQVAALLVADPRADLATLCTPVTSAEEFLNHNIVKVVRAADGAALYFSRAPVPFDRDAALAASAPERHAGALRHLGIYAYRVAALLRMTALPVSPLEAKEKLEQLRALEAGMRIAVGVASQVPGIGVDTADDIERLRGSLKPG
ncbi:MAG: 3-deoxy-manno-octulosonate cytidylyltransferase [Steroidobacteraceae bacterium]